MDVVVEKLNATRGYIKPHLAVLMFTLTIASGCFALMLFVLEKGEQRAIFEQKDKTRLLAHALENTLYAAWRMSLAACV